MADPEGEIMVLEDHITHDDFLRVANGQGWQLRQTQRGDGEHVSFQEIWTTADGKGVINFIDDPTLLSRQIWIRGEHLHELHFELSRRLPAWEQEELLEHAVTAAGHDEAVKAILDLSAGFLRPDPDVIRMFEEYMSASSALIRKATLQAIAYRMWPEAKPLVESAAANDPEESVRAFAATLLQHPATTT